MKKLLILLFSILISVSSRSEIIICSGVYDFMGTDLVQTSIYKRVGDKFVYQVGDEDIYFDYVFEDDNFETLILQKNMPYGSIIVVINKNRKIGRYAHIEPDFVNTWETKCQFIE